MWEREREGCVCVCVCVYSIGSEGCVYSRGSEGCVCVCVQWGSDLAADGRAEECQDHWGDWSSPSYHQPHPPAQPALDAETHSHTRMNIHGKMDTSFFTLKSCGAIYWMGLRFYSALNFHRERNVNSHDNIQRDKIRFY